MRCTLRPRRHGSAHNHVCQHRRRRRAGVPAAALQRGAGQPAARLHRCLVQRRQLVQRLQLAERGHGLGEQRRVGAGHLDGAWAGRSCTSCCWGGSRRCCAPVGRWSCGCWCRCLWAASRGWAASCCKVALDAQQRRDQGWGFPCWGRCRGGRCRGRSALLQSPAQWPPWQHVGLPSVTPACSYNVKKFRAGDLREASRL